MKITDVMTTDIQKVSPVDTAQQAASFMLKADTGSIPVCEGDKIVGMITDRDIAVRGTAKGLGPDAKVSQLMSDDVICASCNDSVEDIARQMAERQVRRMPVIDENQQLVGMVSLGDLSRHEKDQAATTALEGVTQPGGDHQQG
jgi:CBS domain-containing protein